MSSNNVEAIRLSLNKGQFREALQQLGSGVSDPYSLATKAELYLLQGQPESARKTAEAVLREQHLTDDVRARALFVSAAGAWELGDRTESSSLERAATAASKAGDPILVSRIHLHVLERIAEGGADYHRCVPLCASALRSVLHSGDRFVLAEAHVTFARLEARIGNTHLAHRHLALVGSLLRETPSSWLEASANLTHAIVYSMQGDMQTACELAETAGQKAAASGWIKGEAIAAANLAYFYACSSMPSEARRCLRSAREASYQPPGLRYALLDTETTVAFAEGDYELAERLWLESERSADQVAVWYHLRGIHTRARGLMRQGRIDEGLAVATQGLSEARRLKNDYFQYVFGLTIAEIEISRGQLSHLPSELARSTDPSLGLIGARRRMIGKALDQTDPIRAKVELASATRILDLAGSRLEWDDGVEYPVHDHERQAMPPAFDDAVALLELAGYPHVLAREVYALLELSGAVQALALVARGDRGVRTILSHGWTEAEIAGAAATPGERMHVVCGVHRDETWEIVADVKPTLTHRCTAVAIRKLVETAVTLDRYRREEKQRAALWPADTLETDGGLWISEQMTELLSIARRIAPVEVTVLLTGETGTGKEVLARAIHRASPRAAKPFIPFNCSAVPRDMLESQLFGYRKGAFTGADTGFEGVIRGAAGGTLFLDEIAEIGPELQPKLLRFLETHEVHALGETQPVKVDVRVIAATNGDLEALVADGRLREDLFYRLNVVRLKLPPLRERREEIPPLIDHYLRKCSDELKKGRLTLDDETLEFLLLYSWPGNVRQLVNEVRRIVAFSEPDGTITPALLSPEIQASRRTIRLAPGDEPEIRIRMDQPLNDAVEVIEQAMVKRALERARGNYENAARLLGISRKGLFLKRRRWGMRRAS